VSVHGWIYDVRDGLLRDLGCTATTLDEVAVAYDHAIHCSAMWVARVEN
jgi:carbonic anhydrase